mgnify:CR=1 FL=1
MGMMSEFKAFALRGNVVDMAIGVIIGGAFGLIVGSVVSDILMPVVGKMTGGVNFKDLYVSIDGKSYPTLKAAQDAGAAMNYGNTIDTLIKFVIVAFFLFLVIKAMNSAKKKEEAKPSGPAAPPAQEVLLTEIRDLLRKNAKA